MNVILHIGAHRCATTSFQHYLRLNAEKLRKQGIGLLDPRRTRNGLFSGLIPAPRPATGRDQQRRAVGRVQLRLAANTTAGRRNLVVSDENMLGSVRENLRLGDLYCSAGERVARHFQAFDGYVSDVILNIRSLEGYWASALGYSLSRGFGVMDKAQLARLVDSVRSWREVIGDVACAVPGARLWVLPFETFAGRPETQLAAVTGCDAPKTHARRKLNATPLLADLRSVVGAKQAALLPEGDGRWQPFSRPEIAALRERYADDLMWLAAGADGLAWLMDDPERTPSGPNPPTDMTRGTPYDDPERRMARAR